MSIISGLTLAALASKMGFCVSLAVEHHVALQPAADARLRYLVCVPAVVPMHALTFLVGPVMKEVVFHPGDRSCRFDISNHRGTKKVPLLSLLCRTFFFCSWFPDAGLTDVSIQNSRKPSAGSLRLLLRTTYIRFLSWIMSNVSACSDIDDSVTPLFLCPR